MGVAACCCPGWAATWKAGHNKLTSSRRQAGPENWWKPANIFTATTRYFYTPRLTAGLVWPWCDVTAHWCHVSLWTHVKTGQGCLHHTMTLATVPRTGGLITQHGLGCEDGAMAGWSPETSRCKEQELEITQLALGSLPPLSSAARPGGAGRGGWRRQWRPGGAAFYPLRQTHLAAGPSTTHWARFGDMTGHCNPLPSTQTPSQGLIGTELILENIVKITVLKYRWWLTLMTIKIIYLSAKQTYKP